MEEEPAWTLLSPGDQRRQKMMRLDITFCFCIAIV